MKSDEYLGSRHSAMIADLKSRIHDNRVISAMSRVKRHLFVPQEAASSAYDDTPLPIGFGQTISQPYIVALMTSALDIKSSDKVLEIGGGSGYQAAILAELAAKVITVERIPELAKIASARLLSLGYNNIEVKVAKDKLGWQEEAPFDAILVAAASPAIPDDLLNQLNENGRMVIPVGDRHQQELLRVIKHRDEVEIEKLGACRFVALIGKDAWEER